MNQDELKTRPNTPQSSEVDVDWPALENAKSEKGDTTYPEITIPYSEYVFYEELVVALKQGSIKTPAENVRCDVGLAALDGVDQIEFDVQRDRFLNGQTKKHYYEILETIRAALQQPKAQWLPIEKLLDDGLRVMFWSVKYNHVWVDRLENCSWMLRSDDRYPTHWMPLPDAPKKDGV